LACPFFMPVERYEGGAWSHPSRLPLGGGWKGYCTVPGHAGEIPSDEQVQESCNLGYASGCPRCPVERSRDSVRFGVTGDVNQRVLVCYVCEREHRPAEHGSLEFDLSRGDWVARHDDPRIQKMAECYLESYLQRRKEPAGMASTLSRS
jgi:hypothetical protein